MHSQFDWGNWHEKRRVPFRRARFSVLLLLFGHLCVFAGADDFPGDVDPPQIFTTFRTELQYTFEGQTFNITAYQGIHGYAAVDPLREYFAWRMDTAYPTWNTTDVAVMFRNGTQRRNHFFVGSQGDTVCAADTLSIAPNAIQFAWLHEPGLSPSHTGNATIRNVSTEQWESSQACRVVWIHVLGPERAGIPLRMQLSSFDGGRCVQPIKTFEYFRFAQLSAADSQLDSSLFNVPLECRAEKTDTKPQNKSHGPEWVWFGLACVLSLVAGAAIGFLVGWRRRDNAESREQRQRYASHLLDAL